MLFSSVSPWLIGSSVVVVAITVITILIINPDAGTLGRAAVSRDFTFDSIPTLPTVEEESRSDGTYNAAVDQCLGLSSACAIKCGQMAQTAQRKCQTQCELDYETCLEETVLEPDTETSTAP